MKSIFMSILSMPFFLSLPACFESVPVHFDTPDAGDDGDIEEDPPLNACQEQYDISPAAGCLSYDSFADLACEARELGTSETSQCYVSCLDEIDDESQRCFDVQERCLHECVPSTVTECEESYLNGTGQECISFPDYYAFVCDPRVEFSQRVCHGRCYDSHGESCSEMMICLSNCRSGIELIDCPALYASDNFSECLEYDDFAVAACDIGDTDDQVDHLCFNDCIVDARPGDFYCHDLLEVCLSNCSFDHNSECLEDYLGEEGTVCMTYQTYYRYACDPRQSSPDRLRASRCYEENGADCAAILACMP